MSDKELVVFEKRFEGWRIAHPNRWIATTDIRETVNFISEQTKEIRKNQLEAANHIIVSQEQVREEIEKVAINSGRIIEGIKGLSSAFEWGFSEIIWHLEQENKILVEILKVLQSPLDSQAKELKKRAKEAYRNGWIDDALQDFLESEKKNRYDFTVHQSLANIYLFHKKEPEKALSYYKKAEKYATPKSPYYTSLSLLHIGLIKYLQEDFQEAYKASLKAVELSPELSEAHYQCAQYCAKLGKQEEAIEHLDKAIAKDRNYCIKADSEKDFDLMKDRLQRFFKVKRNEAYRQAKKGIEISHKSILWVKKIAKEHEIAYRECNEKLKNAKANKDRAIRILKRTTFFDSLDAYFIVSPIPNQVLGYLKMALSHQISGYEKKIEEYADRHNMLSFFIAGGLVALVWISNSLILFSEGEIGEGIVQLLFGIVGVPMTGSILGGIFWLFGLPIKSNATKELKHKIEEVRAVLNELN